MWLGKSFHSCGAETAKHRFPVLSYSYLGVMSLGDLLSNLRLLVGLYGLRRSRIQSGDSRAMLYM